MNLICPISESLVGKKKKKKKKTETHTVILRSKCEYSISYVYECGSKSKFLPYPKVDYILISFGIKDFEYSNNLTLIYSHSSLHLDRREWSSKRKKKKKRKKKHIKSQNLKTDAMRISLMDKTNHV